MHNQAYWQGVPYYAFGLGAASYLEGRRFSRPAKMQAYAAWVAALREKAALVNKAALASALGGERGAAGEGALPAADMPPESRVRSVCGYSVRGCAAQLNVSTCYVGLRS